MTGWLARLIAAIGEELLLDLFQITLREVLLRRKKADIHGLVDDLKRVIDETAKTEGMSDDEKNARLIPAGRAVIERLRKQ